MPARLLLAAAAALAWTVGAANATVYNLSASFSLSNPSGPFSFGTYTLPDDPGSFTLLTSPSWVHGPMRGYDGGDFLVIQRNTSDVDYFGIAPGAVALHPNGIGQQAVVRFTAPKAGTYKVNAAFQRTDPNGGMRQSTGAIYLDGRLQNSGTLIGTTSVLTHSSVSALAAGSVFDFVVGMGNDGYYHDTTGLNVTITEAVSPVPLPGGLPLLGAALGGFALLRRRIGRG